MKKITTAFLLFALAFLGACETSDASSTKIDGPTAREMVANGALLLDVRTPQEYRQGHIEDAKNIPVQSLAQRLDELPDDKSQPIVVYCRSGNRSARAASFLKEKGYENVKDLGGIGEW